MAGQKSKKYKVLIVDDEKKILTVAKKLLSSEGYEVLTTDNAEEALDILEERGPIAVVLSDNRMPAMRGTEFFKKIKTICPNTVRILMTAYYDSQLIEDIVNAGEVYRYLKKPLDFKLVSQTIQAGIQQYERNLEVEALGEDLLRLNHEKTELESTSASLDATINKLTRVKKFLVVSLIGMAVTFGIYQVFSA
ncbi:MAG: response regulator, partial [Nitrospinaceae bacterium]|nr:response regulator [Nitrospinaceae bacterium]NIR56550.1 response regulator [Nitrospinaceae bacterium]NIS87009.1 response regulator [Nitrospinaceae bacterium]NIT83851.1 response regulator [Nitrospinaceae bacterium]NIU46059.1 response regulator [Nitrospinaceae bacterium]